MRKYFAKQHAWKIFYPDPVSCHCGGLQLSGQVYSPGDYGLGNLKDLISYGASPRASISLSMAAKAYAFIKRRGYVIPEDVRAVCNEVLRHRLGLSYEAEAENVTTEQIISEVLNAVIVP